MRSLRLVVSAAALLRSVCAAALPLPEQEPLALDQELLHHHASVRPNVSVALFAELEELARLVDVSYCSGISKPFTCLSRCAEFPDLELVTAWNTGPLLSDSSGYVALDHGKQRIIVAFRGTYSIANTIVDLSTVPQQYVPYPGDEGDDSDPAPNSADGPPKCHNCTVHMGFNRAWRNTRDAVLSTLEENVSQFPKYRLNLVGHSLGGAVAALGGLDMLARGWDPLVTTFGEPRLGNAHLATYLDGRFNLGASDTPAATWAGGLKYRRVTHVDDPVPLLPLTEWGYAMHAGEIFIEKPSLSPDVQDLRICFGDADPSCIAGQDSTVSGPQNENETSLQKRDLLGSVRQEIEDVTVEPWGIPTSYKLWQLFFAHRDYFWRLGLCVPGGDPFGGGKKFESAVPPVDL